MIWNTMPTTDRFQWHLGMVSSSCSSTTPHPMNTLWEFPWAILDNNIAPNEYAVGISMGYTGQEENKMIVWTANMNDLVTENSPLNVTDDGNLVISNANGSSVWSSNSSGRGVVGCELRNDGNLVLYNENNKTVWQSFDQPTESLLVGQSLNIGRVKKLVSRASEKDGSEGPYCLEIEAVLKLKREDWFCISFFPRLCHTRLSPFTTGIQGTSMPSRTPAISE